MDEEAFDHYVRTSSRRLLRSAWLLTGEWAEAEDLVQNVLVLVWKQWSRVSAADSPDAYVQTMLANSFLSARRRARWTREMITAEPPEPHRNADGDPELRQAVAAALDTLPPRQRAVLVLRYFCDLSVEDTADALGCSAGNVKSQSSRAIDRLERTTTLHALREDAS